MAQLAYEYAYHEVNASYGTAINAKGTVQRFIRCPYVHAA
jgi:hypothetical protein